jgi:hypothetical protein
MREWIRTRPIVPLLIGGNVEEVVGTDLNDDLGGGRSNRHGTYFAPVVRMESGKLEGAEEKLRT